MEQDNSQRRSRFVRPPGPNADPFTRRDETLAFSDQEGVWQPPDWFGRVEVVLFETTDPVNVGGVVRAMANTGFGRLRLVNPIARIEAWDLGGIAHYTQHIVEAIRVHPSLDEALADAQVVLGLSGKHHRAKRNARPMHLALADVAERARSGQVVALLFGREDRGLPNEALDRCHAVTTIPTNPAYPSLNLAQAALLVLFNLFEAAGGAQQAPRPPRRSAPPAAAALLEDLFADLERSLDAIEFFKTRSRVSIMRSLRAALYRADLDRREASLLRAIAIEIRRYLQRRGLLADIGPVGAQAPAPVDTSPGS